MTLAIRCDNCKKFDTYNRESGYRHAYILELPLNQGTLHFCSMKCLKEYINKEE